MILVLRVYGTQKVFHRISLHEMIYFMIWRELGRAGFDAISMRRGVDCRKTPEGGNAVRLLVRLDKCSCNLLNISQVLARRGEPLKRIINNLQSVGTLF
jgi:hypothetical protein